MIIINRKEDCTGCSACVNVCSKHCIEMIPDEEGFNYPKVDYDQCIGCNLCVNICPIINHREGNEPIRILGIKNRNKQKQFEAASGGVFSELAEYLIRENGSVVGALWNKDFSVSHQMAHNLKDCKAFMGSKYQQSQIGFIYQDIKEVLITGRKVLFSGTPCQVAGLKHFLRKTYDNLYTCDLICHGVPSPKVFQSYIRFIEKQYRQSVVSINMRDKTDGWDASGIRINFSDGRSIRKNRETNLFNCIYSVHYATRLSCHHCAYTNFYREGDITIGDFWTIKKANPTFFDNKGVSAIFINTSKGEKLFESVQSNFEIIESNQKEVLQTNLYKSVSPSSVRKQFFNVYLEQGFEKAVEQFMDYGCVNQIKKIVRKIFRKLHLPIPPIIKSTIRK